MKNNVSTNLEITQENTQKHPLFLENEKLKQRVVALERALLVAANQLMGVSVAIQVHGQNIDTEFFVTNYDEFSRKAMEVVDNGR